jgi:response regulator RpfG family c-di-GMP phosphodiesterase
MRSLLLYQCQRKGGVSAITKIYNSSLLIHPMKILLIEDDTLLTRALAELLTANYYTIDLANNGQTGLNLAMSAEYDISFCLPD